MCGVPVDRAEDYLQPPHRGRPPRRRLRADRGSRRGPQARRQVRREARGGAAGHAGHHHRGDAARSRPRQSAGRRGPGARIRHANGATGSPPSTSRQARSRCTKAVAAGLQAEIARLEPREILVPDGVLDEPSLKALWRETRASVTPLARDGLDAGSGERRLCAFFGVSTLAGFGAFTRAEIAAAAAVVAYVERTQLGARPPLSPPRRERAGRHAADRRRDPRQSGADAHASAASAPAACWPSIDRTLTPAGGRLLAERLAGPLTDPAAIDARLDAVAWFVDDPVAARRRPRRAQARAGPVARARPAHLAARRPARPRRPARRAGRRRALSPG